MRKEGGVELRLFHPPPFRTHTHTLPSVSEGWFHYIPSFSFICKRACVGESGGTQSVCQRSSGFVSPPPRKAPHPPPPIVCCN